MVKIEFIREKDSKGEDYYFTRVDGVLQISSLSYNLNVAHQLYSEICDRVDDFQSIGKEEVMEVTVIENKRERKDG